MVFLRRLLYLVRLLPSVRAGIPVLAVGNLTVGGSGKTPLAAEIARLLLDLGERPAILSRGYARKIPSEGVIVVSDGMQMQADVDRSGDEPFMLARMVPQAVVLVCASRYVAGRLAESRLGCTVHVLDDGFQHFELRRDIDLLIAPNALDDVRTLPSGRFREPLDAASAAVGNKQCQDETSNCRAKASAPSISSRRSASSCASRRRPVTGVNGTAVKSLG